MKVNKDSLKSRANNISKKLGISQNVVYNRFFYDAFLCRLSRSQYRNSFILKGGLYLSSLLGIDTRNTMDIDFYLRKIKMDEEKVLSIIKEVCSIDVDDDITFEIIKAGDIREEDIYGGFQIIVLGRLGNVKCQFGIDVATGDPIVPSERNFEYACLVTGEVLPLKTYSLESVVAEKLETVLSRGIFNSRSKDFYDLYVLRKTEFSNLDVSSLKNAFKETCRYRNFRISKDEANALMNEISNNGQISARWNSYCNNVKYTGDLPLAEVIVSIKEWIDIIF